jgi:hypothetical protein
MRLVWDSATDGHWVDNNDEVEDGTTLRVRMQEMPFLRDSKPTQLTDTFHVDDADLDAHRPGYRILGDKARETVRNARQEMIDRTTSAWRMDDARRRKADPDDEDDDDDDEDQQDARSRDARKFARPSQEGSHAGRHQAANQDARLGATGSSLLDIRRPALEARAAYVRDLQTAWRRPATQVTPDPIRRTYEPKRAIGPRSAKPQLAPRDGAQPDLGGRPEDMEEFYRKRDLALSEAWKTPTGRMTPQTARTAPGPAGFIEATASGDPAARAAAIERQGERWRGGR